MATTKKLLLQFGDGAQPEEFAHSCTINTSQDFTIEATTTDATDPNCQNPDAPGWVLRSVDTLSANINGAGTADPVSYGVLRAKALSGETDAKLMAFARERDAQLPSQVYKIIKDGQRRRII